MPSIANISRVYNFDNRLNGNLGPDAFYFKKPSQNIVIKQIFDLSIYIILSNKINTDLIKLLQEIKEYKINIKLYLDNTNNTNFIKNEIINDDTPQKFLILDDKISNTYKNLKVTYINIDTNNIDTNNIIQYIYFMLFSII